MVEGVPRDAAEGIARRPAPLEDRSPTGASEEVEHRLTALLRVEVAAEAQLAAVGDLGGEDVGDDRVTVAATTPRPLAELRRGGRGGRPERRLASREAAALAGERRARRGSRLGGGGAAGGTEIGGRVADQVLDDGKAAARHGGDAGDPQHGGVATPVVLERAEGPFLVAPRAAPARPVERGGEGPALAHLDDDLHRHGGSTARQARLCFDPGMASPEQRAPIRGAEIAFHVSGTGPDFIFGHGLTGSRANDDEMSPIDWREVPARLVRYDARGHGRSSSGHTATSYSWEQLAHDQLALADHCGIGRYVAGGASMGCGTALHAAVIAPERIRGLVLVIPPTAWESRAERAALWAETGAAVEEHGVEALVRLRALQPLPDPYADDPTRRARTLAATRAWEARRLAEVLRGAAFADLPSREEVATITAPSLILAWSGDPAHPLTTAEALAGLIGPSELSVASSPDELAGWTQRVAAFVAALF